MSITNNTGHKLPTGYPESRRIWLNVTFYNKTVTLIGESGAYNPDSGVLTRGPDVKICETKPGLDEVTAPLPGADPGPSFHFVLDNRILKDNRIPRHRRVHPMAHRPLTAVPVGQQPWFILPGPRGSRLAV